MVEVQKQNVVISLKGLSHARGMKLSQLQGHLCCIEGRG